MTLKKTLTLMQLKWFADAMICNAEIDGDDMLARLYDKDSGLFMWIVPLC